MINTREDLDALVGTLEHEAFMAMLAGTLYRVERDDVNKTWIAVADNSTIQRYGFVRSDFPGAVPPPLPVWEPTASPIPPTVAGWQAKTVLDRRGHAAAVLAFINASPDPAVRRLFEGATNWERYSSVVLAVQAAMKWTDAYVDELWAEAATAMPQL